MIASIGDLAGDLIGELGYAGLVVLMAVEHVFPPIPSELVLPLAGFEVARGNLSFAGAVAASTAGSLVWNTVLIVAGQQLGSRWSEVGEFVGPIAQWVLVAIIPLTIVALLLRRRRRASRT